MCTLETKRSKYFRIWRQGGRLPTREDRGGGMVQSTTMTFQNPSRPPMAECLATRRRTILEFLGGIRLRQDQPTTRRPEMSSANRDTDSLKTNFWEQLAVTWPICWFSKRKLWPASAKKIWSANKKSETERFWSHNMSAAESNLDSTSSFETQPRRWSQSMAGAKCQVCANHKYSNGIKIWELPFVQLQNQEVVSIRWAGLSKSSKIIPPCLQKTTGTSKLKFLTGRVAWGKAMPFTRFNNIIEISKRGRISTCLGSVVHSTIEAQL